MYKLLALLTLLASTTANAVCPVCTVAVGAGLGVSRWLGIDDLLVSIWMGGLTVSLIVWTNNYLEKKNITATWTKILNVLIYYSLTFSIYLLPNVQYGQHTLWGIDKILLGIVLGSFGLYFGNVWYQYLKAKNGGHAHFAFQKVVMPVGILIILTAIFAFIV